MSDLLTRLGASTLLPLDQLLSLIRSAPHRYKVYQIPKRKPGEYRTIAQPAREVKALQYWVMKYVLGQFKVHPSATAYRKRRSILHNAKAHARGRFLLKMDFKDFFPSIKARDFRQFLQNADSTLVDEDIAALCQILFWKPKDTQELCLSIGAPTSPLLSNVLMSDFDQWISSYCSSLSVNYTRYADDLTFSATRSADLQAVENEVIAFCQRLRSPLLTVNHAKTVRVSKREARRVTGLVLTNDRKVSIGRDEKRRVRAAVHYFALNKLTGDEVAKLRGMLAYINSVEPEFITRLRDKYGSDVIRRCLNWRRA